MKINKMVGLGLLVVVLTAAWIVLRDSPQLKPGPDQKGFVDEARARAGAESSSRSVDSERQALSNISSAGYGDVPLEKRSFQEISVLANKGDAVAQRILAERYQDCSIYSLSPAKHLATVEGLAGLRGLSKPTTEKIKSMFVKLCADVDEGQPIPGNATALWLEQSSAKGDLIAKAKLAAIDPESLSADAANQLLLSMVSSDDPRALFEFSNAAPRMNPQGIDPRFAEFVGSPNDELIWAMAACRKGAPCGPGSRIMDQVCMNALYCNYQNYEDFVYGQMVPAEGRGAFNKKVDKLMAVKED